MLKVIKVLVLISILASTGALELFSQQLYEADASSVDYPKSVDPPRYWLEGRSFGINKDPGSYMNGGNPPYYLDRTLYPALLVHSGYEDTYGLKAILRLQTGKYDTNYDNWYGESKIEFWSNDYSFGSVMNNDLQSNELQWQVGQIATICNQPEKTSINLGTRDLKGGVALFCSAGKDIPSSQDRATEVLRVIDGKAGIRMAGQAIPNFTLDVRGQIFSGGYDDITGSQTDGAIGIESKGWTRMWFGAQRDPETGRDLGFGINHGGLPGLQFEDRYLADHNDWRPPAGALNSLTFYGWGNRVGVGCNPMPLEDYNQYEDPNGDIHTINPARSGKFTISDSKYPYWNDGSWQKWHADAITLRVERRDVEVENPFNADGTVNTEFENFTLISAGVNRGESFLHRANGNTIVNGKFGINCEPNKYLFEINGASDEVNMAVQGITYMEELHIELKADWPDYVFDADYSLPSLNQVEESIKANGHLPNFPSAKEVKESGLNVAEMQTKMMQKIEELTLYVIELKKENEKLQSQINQINK